MGKWRICQTLFLPIFLAIRWVLTCCVCQYMSDMCNVWVSYFWKGQIRRSATCMQCLLDSSLCVHVYMRMGIARILEMGGKMCIVCEPKVTSTNYITCCATFFTCPCPHFMYACLSQKIRSGFARLMLKGWKSFLEVVSKFFLFLGEGGRGNCPPSTHLATLLTCVLTRYTQHASLW